MKIKSKSKSFDYWTNYYRAASRSDYISDKSRLKRCAISKRLFACKEIKNSFGANDDVEIIKTIESKSLDSTTGHAITVDAFDDHGDIDINHVSKYSFEETEALLDEIEEQSHLVDEILRIRDILLNPKEWSDSTLFESLRRLQFMDFTLFLLQATEIGKAVNSLRKQSKHRSNNISQLAQILIHGWKQIAEEWLTATTTPIAGSQGTPESLNPSVVDDEEGLPTPPMDEGALFATTQIGSMDLSHFFDGMDDNGNDRRRCLNSQNIAKMKSPAPNEASIVPKDSKCQREKKNHAAVRLNRPVAADSSLGSSPKRTIQQKRRFGPNTPQKISKGVVSKSPQVGQLEASKRKLGEGYQQAENVKRQRIPCLNSQNIAKMKSLAPNEAKFVPKDGKCQKNDAVVRLNKPVTADSSLASSPKRTIQQKGRFDPNSPQKISKGVVPNSPQVDQLDKFKPLDDAAIKVKLEASKRKLLEGYQQAENAKRQRRVQIIELCKLPKQGAGQQKPLLKSGNHKKQQAHRQ